MSEETKIETEVKETKVSIIEKLKNTVLSKWGNRIFSGIIGLLIGALGTFNATIDKVDGEKYKVKNITKSVMEAITAINAGEKEQALSILSKSLDDVKDIVDNLKGVDIPKAKEGETLQEKIEEVKTEVKEKLVKAEEKAIMTINANYKEDAPAIKSVKEENLKKEK